MTIPVNAALHDQLYAKAERRFAACWPHIGEILLILFRDGYLELSDLQTPESDGEDAWNAITDALRVLADTDPTALQRAMQTKKESA